MVLTGVIAAYGLAGESLTDLKISDDHPVKIAADLAGAVTLGAVMLLAPLFAGLAIGFKLAGGLLKAWSRLTRR